MSFLSAIRDQLKAKQEEPVQTDLLLARTALVAAEDAAPKVPVPSAIDDAGDLDAAAQWFRWASTRMATLTAVHKQTRALTDDQLARESRLEQFGTTLPELVEHLQALLTDYACRSPDLFARAQTHKLPGVDLARSVGKRTVDCPTGTDAAQQLATRLNLREAAASFNRDCHDLLALLPLLKITATPDKPAILKALAEGRITETQLALFGITTDKPAFDYRVALAK